MIDFMRTRAARAAVLSLGALAVSDARPKPGRAPRTTLTARPTIRSNRSTARSLCLTRRSIKSRLRGRARLPQNPGARALRRGQFFVQFGRAEKRDEQRLARQDRRRGDERRSFRPPTRCWAWRALLISPSSGWAGGKAKRISAKHSANGAPTTRRMLFCRCLGLRRSQTRRDRRAILSSRRCIGTAKIAISQGLFSKVSELRWSESDDACR